MEGEEGLSKGTMTAKAALRMEGRASIETLWWGGKYAKCPKRVVHGFC
jgi:hypothetical protein